MATSGSTDWTLNRDQLITASLRKLGVLPSGGTPTTNQINEANDSLQGIVKAFNADGMPLWKINSTSFSTVAGTSSYTVGTGQTINIPRPLKFIKGLVVPTGSDPIPMEIVPRYDFLDLPSSATGMPLQLTYVQGLTTQGQISLWPAPDAVYSVRLYYQAPFEDMDASTNDFDFPAEWMMAIIYTLAWAMSPEYGVPILDRQQLKIEADYWHGYALSMGAEEGSIRFVPDTR